MKVVITIEDTTAGVVLDMKSYRNGVQDHPPDSLAVMHTAQIQQSLAHTVKCAHFNTQWKDEAECAPTRRNLLT